MADIRPFRAYRPASGKEKQTAALPYDVYNREEACRVVRENPDSFLAIDRAETSFTDEVDTYAPQVYEKAGELLWDRIGRGDFIQEDKPCYYLYELTMEGRSQTGIAACACVDDYLENRIKKHENTRADKEQDRICHVDRCDMQTGPIFLAFRATETLRRVIAQACTKEPVYDFVSEDGIGHRVWVITEQITTDTIQEAFREMDALYIADGHHRCASAAKVCQMRRQQQPGYTGEEEFNRFLAVLFPDEELRILDYNRVVKDLNGLTREAFLEAAGKSFRVTQMGRNPYYPDRKGSFGMFLEEEWYRLDAMEEIKSEDAVKGLDVSLLQDYLLEPVLGIRDPKVDQRIDFVGGIRGLKELERRVHTDCRVAFALYPTSIGELFAVADAGRLMPPKSTWFEPKLRSGLFLHALETRKGNTKSACGEHNNSEDRKGENYDK